jgi:hypothetical protein
LTTVTTQRKLEGKMPRITEKKTERKGRKRERKSPLEGHFSGGSVPAPRGKSGGLLVESWWNTTRHGSEAKNPQDLCSSHQ